MKVMVTHPQGGYFGVIRQRQGDVFLIPDEPRRTPSAKELNLAVCKEIVDKKGTVPEAFSSLWMRKAPQGTALQTTGAKVALKASLGQIASSARIPGSVEAADLSPIG